MDKIRVQCVKTLFYTKMIHNCLIQNIQPFHCCRHDIIHPETEASKWIIYHNNMWNPILGDLVLTFLSSLVFIAESRCLKYNKKGDNIKGIDSQTVIFFLPCMLYWCYIFSLDLVTLFLSKLLLRKESVYSDEDILWIVSNSRLYF